ncbi:MAG: hypothetical protein ACI87W_002003 [Halieaceae bacterium]|jgi:hypothetical protein
MGTRPWAKAFLGPLLLLLVLPLSPQAQPLLGEEPALGAAQDRMRQQQIADGTLSLTDIRHAGLTMFATQFRRTDGYGDGPMDFFDPTSPGGRPMLQDNGAFLRVNGLDGQSCLDCHSIVSADSMPMILGVGGAGGISNSVMFLSRNIDVADTNGNGFAAFDGRLINPLSLFGVGGVQLLAKEMTLTLQAQKALAIANPGQPVSLRAKGVRFGSIIADDFGDVDTSAVKGVSHDLVVRPFGRKGDFATVRGFDLDALMFHMGMQPVEVVGLNVDADGDGVVNEVFTGEVSALEIFVTTQETPVQLALNDQSQAGKQRFRQVGCTNCHRPVMHTVSTTLSYSQPEISADPEQNVFYSVDLTAEPTQFRRSGLGGVAVPLFSDLKRHNMGDALAETFHGTDDRGNREFVTAKLWGVADTAPYLHDGRAFTLNEAIMLHGGEAQPARNRYVELAAEQKNELLSFLLSLRNPRSPNADVLP